MNGHRRRGWRAGPVTTYVPCHWCRSGDDTRAKQCPGCGHDVDRAPADCRCSKCNPEPKE